MDEDAFQARIENEMLSVPTGRVFRSYDLTDLDSTTIELPVGQTSNQSMEIQTEKYSSEFYPESDDEQDIQALLWNLKREMANSIASELRMLPSTRFKKSDPSSIVSDAWREINQPPFSGIDPDAMIIPEAMKNWIESDSDRIDNLEQFVLEDETVDVSDVIVDPYNTVRYSGILFVDTNTLGYQSVSSEPDYQVYRDEQRAEDVYRASCRVSFDLCDLTSGVICWAQ